MRLLIDEPDAAPRQVDAEPGLTIGRGAKNSCPLQDHSASSSHAHLVLDSGQLAIEDRGSRNGTHVGKRKLGEGERHVLANDDVIRIGRCTIRVLAPNPSMMETMLPDDVPVDLMEQTAQPGELQIDAVDLAATIQPDSPQQTIPPSASPAPPSEPPQRGPAPNPAVTPPPPAAVRPPADVSPAAAQESAATPGSESSVMMRTAMGEDLELSDVEIKERLRALQVRLVFVAHREPRTAPITVRTTHLGRRDKGEGYVNFIDESVSSDHAELVYDGKRFIVEALKSRNGTIVGETTLVAGGGKMEVESDQRLRLGSIEAMLIVPPRTGEERLMQPIYQEALTLLEAEGGQVRSAIRALGKDAAAKDHPGESLIQSKAITVRQWTEAVSTARIRVRTGIRSSGPSRWVGFVVAALLVIVAALAYYVFTLSGK